MTTNPIELLTQYDTEIETDEQRERFRVHDDQAAAWAMRRLFSIENKIGEYQRIADAERTRIEDWLTEVNSPLAKSRDYFVGLLMDYARRQRDEDGRKSIPLPHGKITSRSTQPKWHVREDEVLPWARQTHPDVIAVKESLSLTAMKDRFQVVEGRVIDENGEVVPGIIVDPAGISFTVSTEA